MIVGQLRLVAWVDMVKDNFPKFIVLIGPKGSGKATMARYMADKLDLHYTAFDSKVDTVRAVIETAYLSRTNVMYCFENAESMKAEAKNALLKITEEPPENAYFCMTLTSDTYLLDTLKSRAQVLRMEPYSDTQKEWFIKDNFPYIEVGKADRLVKLCTTPGSIVQMYDKIEEFEDYVNLVIDNIAEVAPANAFKSGDKLAIKSGDGYDLRIFWEAFLALCMERLKKDPSNALHYAQGITETCEMLDGIDRAGVNKQQRYDSWVLNIRSVWG